MDGDGDGPPRSLGHGGNIRDRVAAHRAADAGGGSKLAPGVGSSGAGLLVHGGTRTGWRRGWLGCGIASRRHDRNAARPARTWAERGCIYRASYPPPRAGPAVVATGNNDIRPGLCLPRIGALEQWYPWHTGNGDRILDFSTRQHDVVAMDIRCPASSQTPVRRRVMCKGPWTHFDDRHLMRNLTS